MNKEEILLTHNIPCDMVASDYVSSYGGKLNAETIEIASKAITPIYEEDRQAGHGYVKCPSCNQYFPGSHPEHGYTMCEDCVG